MKIVHELKRYPLISKLHEAKASVDQSVVDGLEKALRDERIYVDEFYYDPQISAITLEIYDGDWKHEHLHTKFFITEYLEKLGYKVIHMSQQIGDSDDDCYSARHVFLIREKPQDADYTDDGVINLDLKEGKVEPFNTSRTGFSFYNTFLDPEDKINSRTTSIDYYKFEKGLEGRIVYMTCDKYFEEIAKHVFDKTVEQCKRGLEQDHIDQYAEDIKNGAKYTLPYIDYANEMQEGRHRMLAVEKAFGKDAEAPVLVVELAQPTDEEIKDYAKRRWNTEDPYWIDYVKSGLKSYANQYSSTKYDG